MYFRRIKVFWCLGVISAVLSGIHCNGRENAESRIGVGEAHIIPAPNRSNNRNVVHPNGIRKGRPIVITRAVYPKSERQRRQQPQFGQQILHQTGNNQLAGGANQVQQQRFLQQQQQQQQLLLQQQLQQQQKYQQQLLQQHQLLQQEQMQLQQQINLHHQRLIENQVQQQLLVQHASQPQVITTNELQTPQDDRLREQAEQQAFLSRAVEQERKSYLQKKRREQERRRRVPVAAALADQQRPIRNQPVRGQAYGNGAPQQDPLIGSSSQQQLLAVQNKRRPKKIPPPQRFRKQRLVKLIRIPKQRTKRQ